MASSSRHLDVQELFPSGSSFVIFCAYIILFVSQGLLVTGVQRQQIQGFNPIVVVLLTEFIKLSICVGIYLLRLERHAISTLVKDVRSNGKLLLLYLVPAFLYCLYNNLTFINLELFDVSTYYCLMQFRIVLTAILYQILFRRQLNLIQWFSLFILTSGCFVKEYGLYSNISRNQHSANLTEIHATYAPDIGQNRTQLRHDRAGEQSSGISAVVIFFWSTSLILFQMFCACFAGVYNEYLLKDSATAKNADIILQNIFMYLDSIVCNLLVYIFSATFTRIGSGGKHDALADHSQLPLMTILYNLLSSPLVIILLLNNALSGIVASFFLKSLNSIIKTFASALELFAVTLLAKILFNNSVDIHTLVALLLVTVAMFIYSKNPVSVAPPGETSHPGQTRTKDGFVLLPTSEE